MGLTFPSDLFPQDVVASVTGASGLGSGLAGAGFTLLVGWLIDKFGGSYLPAFFLAGTIPLVGHALCLVADSCAQAASNAVRRALAAFSTSSPDDHSCPLARRPC